MTDVNPAETDFRSITYPDPKQAVRIAMQQTLGFEPHSDPRYDAFANRIIDITGAAFAGVNHVSTDLQQFFPGMAARDSDMPLPDEARAMDCDHGFCVYVVTHERAMAINNVKDYARFATNPVIDELGVQSYIGAPLVTNDGNVIGTVWGVDTKTQTWTQATVEEMKTLSTEVMEHIHAQSTKN